MAKKESKKKKSGKKMMKRRGEWELSFTFSFSKLDWFLKEKKMSASSAITVEICLKDGSEKHFNYKVDDNKAPENSYLSEMSQTIRAAQKEVNEFLTEIVDKEKSEKNESTKCLKKWCQNHV